MELRNPEILDMPYQTIKNQLHNKYKCMSNIQNVARFNMPLKIIITMYSLPFSSVIINLGFLFIINMQLYANLFFTQKRYIYLWGINI